MSNNYKKRFEKFSREEQEKVRKKEEYESEKSRIAWKLHSQIKKVCKEFARINGWKCRRCGVGEFDITKYSGIHVADKIWISVRGDFPDPIYVAVDKGPGGVRILGEKFTEGRLADGIIAACKGKTIYDF